MKTEEIEKLEKLEKTVKDVLKEIEALKDKPKFEVGKWYKDGSRGLYFITKYDKSTINFYGINYAGDWKDKDWYPINEVQSACIATESEVKEALIEEAKRRYKVGDKFKPIVPNVYKAEFGIIEDKYTYFAEPMHGYNSGLANNKNWVFYDGQWAEIIPQEEKITIGGYTVEFLYEGIKIGCKTFTLRFLKTLQSGMKENGFEHVSFDSYKTDLQTINKIIERIK